MHQSSVALGRISRISFVQVDSGLRLPLVVLMSVTRAF